MMLREDDFEKSFEMMRDALSVSAPTDSEDCRFNLDIDRDLIPDMFSDEIVDWLLSDEGVDGDIEDDKASVVFARIEEMKAEFSNWRVLLGYSGFIAKLFEMLKDRNREISFSRYEQPIIDVGVEQIRKMRVVSETLALRKKTFPFSEDEDEQVSAFFHHYDTMSRMLLFNSDIENEIEEAMSAYIDDVVTFSKLHDLWELAASHAGGGFTLHLSLAFLFDPSEPFYPEVVEDIGHALGLDVPVDAFIKGVDFSDITRGWKDPRFVAF